MKMSFLNKKNWLLQFKATIIFLPIIVNKSLTKTPILKKKIRYLNFPEICSLWTLLSQNSYFLCISLTKEPCGFIFAVSHQPAKSLTTCETTCECDNMFFTLLYSITAGDRTTQLCNVLCLLCWHSDSDWYFYSIFPCSDYQMLKVKVRLSDFDLFPIYWPILQFLNVLELASSAKFCTVSRLMSPCFCGGKHCRFSSKNYDLSPLAGPDPARKSGEK